MQVLSGAFVNLKVPFVSWQAAGRAGRQCRRLQTDALKPSDCVLTRGNLETKRGRETQSTKTRVQPPLANLAK